MSYRRAGRPAGLPTRRLDPRASWGRARRGGGVSDLSPCYTALRAAGRASVRASCRGSRRVGSGKVRAAAAGAAARVVMPGREAHPRTAARHAPCMQPLAASRPLHAAPPSTARCPGASPAGRPSLRSARGQPAPLRGASRKRRLRDAPLGTTACLLHASVPRPPTLAGRCPLVPLVQW